MSHLLTAQLFLADADGFGHMDGFGWGMMGMGWLLMVAVVGLIVWAIVQSGTSSSRQSSDPTSSAQTILAERFARGEIDGDEYRRRLSELER